MKLKLLWIGLVVLAVIGCQSKTEVVEDTNEFGRKIRYERRKSDFAKEGLFQRFYEDGVVAEEAMYQNDTLHGTQKFFYPTGKLEREQNFNHGVDHGPYKKYYENGQLEISYQFVNGAIEGESIRYYPNGKVMEVVAIVHNEENGPFKEYYDTGILKAEGNYIYEDEEAVENGELREYDSTGVLIRVADCVSGICRTKWRK
jgi:antitoxin component YwqK of YwqJK toxin-antitoxin module